MNYLSGHSTADHGHGDDKSPSPIHLEHFPSELLSHILDELGRRPAIGQTQSEQLSVHRHTAGLRIVRQSDVGCRWIWSHATCSSPLSSLTQLTHLWLQRCRSVRCTSPVEPATLFRPSLPIWSIWTSPVRRPVWTIWANALNACRNWRVWTLTRVRSRPIRTKGRDFSLFVCKEKSCLLDDMFQIVSVWANVFYSLSRCAVCLPVYTRLYARDFNSTASLMTACLLECGARLTQTRHVIQSKSQFSWAQFKRSTASLVEMPSSFKPWSNQLRLNQLCLVPAHDFAFSWLVWLRTFLKKPL